MPTCHQKYWPVLLTVCIFINGCMSISEEYQRPSVNTPASWQRGNGTQAAWPDATWWQGFQAEELNRLIDEAQKNNHDLKAAAARVEEASALARIAGAPLYPTVALGADISRANVTNRSNPKNANTGTFNQFRVAPQASYEIDVWGANKYAAESANDAVLASEYGQQVVRLTLIADVANTYFRILSLNDLIDDAQRNLDVASKAQDVVDAQNAAGRLSTFEVERQRTLLSTAVATIPPLQQQLQLARNTLAILLAKNPEELTLSQTSLRSLNVPDVPVGLPAQLLERRPDIRQAEMNLIAANANIGAARAALFPTLTLNAVAGATAGTMGGLIKSNAGFESISLAMLATIFDGGKLRGQVALTKARRLELAETYQQSIISGFRDVEDALAGVQQFTAQENAQQKAVTHAREVNRIAGELLHSGSRDFTAVLDAQRTLLAAENAADQARFSRFSSVVGLYRALGGGWKTPSSQTHKTSGDPQLR